MSRDQAPDPWQNDSVATGHEGGKYAGMIALLRRTQTLVASTRTPEDVTDAVSAHLLQIVRLLEPWVVPEQRATAGKRRDLPGRGHSLLPPVVLDEQTETTTAGSVCFDRFYLGGNGAVHGGAIPLLFDEVLGWLCNAGGRARARTAYLHVNYRAITPIDTQLVVKAKIESDQGRKRYLTGALYDGNRIVADAEGLFVVLLPGQP